MDAAAQVAKENVGTSHQRLGGACVERRTGKVRSIRRMGIVKTVRGTLEDGTSETLGDDNGGGGGGG